MQQYQTDPDTPVTATVAIPKKDDTASRIQNLEAKLAEQADDLRRMHRDMVRLREIINQLSARIK